MLEAAQSWSSCKYEARDELTHSHGDEPGYNESVYYNFACPSPGHRGPQGGVLRVGLRPTDGYAEMTLLIPLADGTTLFRYQRQELTEFTENSAVYRCDPMTISVLDPHRKVALSYNGTARILPDLAKFGDAPGVEWRAQSDVDVEVDLTFEGDHPLHVLAAHGGLMPVGSEREDNAARDHYEQFGTLIGSLRIGEDIYDLTGSPSLRDHSWGPRHWDKNADTDQLMAYFEDGTRVVTINSRFSDTDIISNGMAWEGQTGELAQTPRFDPVLSYQGTSTVSETLSLSFDINARPVNVTATVLSMLPTRVGTTHRDALALLRLDGDLGPGFGWIDMMRPRVDREPTESE